MVVEFEVFSLVEESILVEIPKVRGVNELLPNSVRLCCDKSELQV